MEKETTGAWLVHHTHKLQGVQLGTQDYEQIWFAGRCGILLNALAGSRQSVLTMDRVKALARANGLNKLEIPTILDTLHSQRLIDKGEAGVSVLGLTTSQTLKHTADIFETDSPESCEWAAINLAEMASHLPVAKTDAAEFVSDTYKISSRETGEILQQCENIGFFDSESASGEQIYFNGNLFRREDMEKANAILHSLSPEDQRLVLELTERLKSSGCLAKSEAVRILDDALYSKMCAIGFIDENSIGNESGTFSFVTRPASFCKFTNSAADDAFDLAKAFVTSLTYGMTSSTRGRGRIRMVEALMQKLIDGAYVGPATAIGQDYKVLELKGVIEVRPYGDGRFNMRLLKREVGQLALQVITDGETGGTPLLEMPGVSATIYHGPETNRIDKRRKLTDPLKQSMANMLSDLRTGGLKQW
jgi:hypothetical protein